MPKEKTKRDNTKVKESINIVTGEIIESRRDAEENLKSLDRSIQDLKANKKAIKKEFDLESKELISQKRFFYKLYKTDFDTLKHLSTPTFKVLKFFEMNMDYRDNSISINGKHPAYSDLSALCNIGLTAFKTAISELKKCNIVAVVRKGKFNIIYMNPEYIEDSKTERTIYNLFK